MKKNVDIPAAEIQTFTKKELTSAEKSLSLIENFEIRSSSDFEFAANALREVAIKHDAIDNKRKDWVGPLSKVVKDINSTFKPVLDSLKSSEKELKGVLGAYKIRAEDREKEIWDLCEADPNIVRSLLEEAKGLTLPEVKGLSIKRVFEGHVTDTDAIPKEFLVPDLKKLQEASMEGDPDIPGWTVSATTQVRTSRK